MAWKFLGQSLDVPVYCVDDEDDFDNVPAEITVQGTIVRDITNAKTYMLTSDGQFVEQ